MSIAAFTVTRADGTTFTFGGVARLAIRETVMMPEPPPVHSPQVARSLGLRISVSARETGYCAWGRYTEPLRWFEVAFVEDDVIARTGNLLRVRKLSVVKELTRDELLGFDLDERARVVADEVASWDAVAWCRGVSATDDELAAAIARWRDGMAPWLDGARLSARVSLLRDGATAAAASLALRAQHDESRDAINWTVSRASAVASSAATSAVAPFSMASPLVATTWDQSRAAAAAARARIGDAVRVAAGDAPADAFAYRNAYTSPLYAFEYHACARLGGVASPWSLIAELYLGGCYPIGFVGDDFVVFAPH